jgi:ubiquinone biosynthesis protein COQ9
MTKLHENRQLILEHAIELAGKTGWTVALLEKAAKAAGLAETYGQVAFPQGLPELIDFYGTDLNERMLKKTDMKAFHALKVRERIEAAVMARLELYEGRKAAVSELLKYYSHPLHGLSAVKNLARVSDTIWRAAGDSSTDFNYYTKRLLLGGVYSSTLLFWLGDDSKGMAATREFLRRRIQNVMEFQKVKGSVVGAAQKASKAAEDWLPRLRFKD